MRETHLSEESLRRLQARDLPPAEVVAALRHIAECEACAERARAAAEEGAARLLDGLAADAAAPPRHLTTEEIVDWARGTLAEDARDALRGHLDECDLCRSDVADLERMPVRKPHWRTALAAAAILAAIALAALLLQPDRRVRTAHPASPPHATVRTPPATNPTAPLSPRYANVEWNELVQQALASGRLPEPPDLGLPRRTPDTIRGGTEASKGVLAPSGIVIDDPRPELRWPRVAGASYVVSIFEGNVEVLHSDPLKLETWTPPRALRRGRTYVWQVEARLDTVSEILPAPPARPAMFHILSAREHAEIEAAHARHPDDSLLLAVLLARSGMTDEANDQLRRLADSSDPRVRRIVEKTLGPAAR